MPVVKGAVRSHIHIRVNGEAREVSSPLNLLELAQVFQIQPQNVVIEHNRQVIPKEELEAALLSEGDEVEIVHFVGGGAEAEPPIVPESPESPAPSEPKPKAKRKPRPKKSETSGSVNGAKNLVIVESPTKAKTLNKFLGSDYQVEASLGHVRDLPKSKMGIDVKDNFKPSYIVMMKAKKTVSKLKKDAKGKEIIYLAADPDREGEAISWHLSEILREAGDQKIHRVVFNEITPDAVRDAFKRPREIDARLVDAQQARRILDRLVGYELSPLLWAKVGKGLSAGRVQSVALRIIVEREREIRAFVPKEYWQITASLSSQKTESEKVFAARFDRIEDKKAEIGNKEEADKLHNAILNLSFKVQTIEKKERQRKPQAPYTTSRLQQEAYNRLGFTAAKTMQVAQKLYEGMDVGGETVGLITYMRTDSVNVASYAQAEAIKWVTEKFGADYLPEKPPVYKSKKGAQEAHEAVRPSSVFRIPEKMQQYLSEDEFRLYELIWKKFVASQMMPAIDEQTAVTIVAGDKYFFKANGKRNLFLGFGIVFGMVAKPASEASEKEEPKSEGEEEDTGDQELPLLQEGEMLKLHELLPTQHFTKPPGRYNDASLVRTLEEKGIGRPSTYAPTIYTLLDRDYANRKGGALMPTELGEIVVDLLVKHFPGVLDIQFTAHMEEELDKIEDGEMEWAKVLGDFYEPFSKSLEAARETMREVRRETIPTDQVCDVCAKQMVIRWGRFGQFLACSGFPECRYTKSMPTGYRCPQPECGGDLVKRQSKRRQVFYGCSKYPNCTYVTRRLPKDGEKLGGNEKPPETDRERETQRPS